MGGNCMENENVKVVAETLATSLDNTQKNATDTENSVKVGQIAAILLPQNVEHGLVITVALPSDEGGQADLAKERIPGPKQDDVGNHPAQTLIALGERTQDHQVRLRHSGFDQRVCVRQFQKGGQLTQPVRYGSHRGKLKGFSTGGRKIHFVCGAVILPALIHTICE